MTLAPRFTITSSIAAGLTAIERAREFLEAARLSEDWLDRKSQRALLLEAHSTTHIEGTKLSLQDAERVWAGESVEHAWPGDVRELLNSRDALRLMSESLASGPITETLIRGIHARLVEGVRGVRGVPGAYRTAQDLVGSRTRRWVDTRPPPEAVPSLMRELVRWLRDESVVHPVLVAGLAQFQLVHVQPFVDGNGRTARLVSLHCLHRAGYDFQRLFTISEYYDRHRTAYYRAIQSVREPGMDATTWLEFFVEGLATQIDEVQAKAELAIRAEAATRKHGLNPRQARVLELLLEADSLGIKEVQRLLPDFNRRTLLDDLTLFVEREVTRRMGAGPATRYTTRLKGIVSIRARIAPKSRRRREAGDERSGAAGRE